MNKTLWFCFVSLLLVLLIVPAATSFAAARIKASGYLTEVAAETRVRIDNKRYIVDKNTRVFDGQKNEILLYRLSYPTRVDYQFTYTPKGAAINRINVIPQ